MSFLQPFILLGLPLILLPIIIHLLNRMRHRNQPWAAMQFLLSANRSSTSQAKLRQLLILLFRVLAVLMLILFLSRPLAGGWLGWALSPAPDAVLVLLDRSASMETQLPGESVTKRERAIEMVSEAARSFENSHLVLIENVFRSPQLIANPQALSELSWTAPSDTAADLPAMLQAALNWLVENRAGTSEVWIASDLQESNWLPDDPRWEDIVSSFSNLPQRVRFRLLAFNQDNEPNSWVSLNQLVRRQRAGRAELNLVLDLNRNHHRPQTVPLSIVIDGARSQAEIQLEGSQLRWRTQVPLGDNQSGGWGRVELPMDANARDNAAYFVYPGQAALRTALVAADSPTRRILQLAAGASTPGQSPATDLLLPSELAAESLQRHSLLAWQGPLPQGPAEERIRNFVAEGGSVIFFPPAQAGSLTFQGLGWGELESAGEDQVFRVVRWEENEGPLARTEEGFSLPMDDLRFERRQRIHGHQTVLAAFEDGSPFLVRHSLGKGQIFFCATLPNDSWSSLSDGYVLVPMLQRLLVAGSARLQHLTAIPCGELSPLEAGLRWTAVDSPEPKDIRVDAGVYQSGDRLLAVNRPEREDQREFLDLERAGALFQQLPVQMFEERAGRNSALQGEIWRLFLIGMLLFLMAESALILPPRSSAAPFPARPSRPVTPIKEQVA